MNRGEKRILEKKFNIKDKTVCGHLLGGLGNQLFVLFATYNYALENNRTPVFFTSPNWRKYYFDTPLYMEVTRVNKILHGAVFNESSHKFEIIPKFEDYLVHLKGYFQSYKYFEKRFSEIVKLLKFDEVKEFFNPNEDFDISLHFRIGDYKNLPDYHPIASVEYYLKALEHFKEDSKVIYFYEVSDEKEVLEKLEIIKNKFPKMSFFPVDPTLEDYGQMFLMSFCKNNIIANSTFSWWGAYFNLNENKKVTYPSKWFGKDSSHLDISDLNPKSWIKIEF